MSTVGNLIRENYINTKPSRVTDFVSRLQPHLAVANTNVSVCQKFRRRAEQRPEAKELLHGKVLCTSREAAAPETVRADLWNACFGGYACEGRYIRGGDRHGRDGMIVVDRRLLEGLNPGSLDVDRGYRLSGRIPSQENGLTVVTEEKLWMVLTKQTPTNSLWYLAPTRAHNTEKEM